MENSLNIKPRSKNVLVAENAREKVTESGIIVEGREGLGESKSGTVLAIGPNCTEVKVGDKILLTWNKAQVVTIDGAQRVIIDEENIVAVLED